MRSLSGSFRPSALLYKVARPLRTSIARFPFGLGRRSKVSRDTHLALSNISSIAEAASASHGQRRRAIFLLSTLFLIIYLPRLSRLETYLMVSMKRSVVLLPAFRDWRQDLDRHLLGLEQVIRKPAVSIQDLSSDLASDINDWLEIIYCPANIIDPYVQARMSKSTALSLELERRCRLPIDRAIKKERDLFGWTEDGRIRLSPADTVFLAGDSLMQGPATRLSQHLRNEGIRPLDASRVSTGLAYPQFFDWVARIEKAIIHEKIDILIVFLGANDTFDMYDEGRRVPVGSEEWRRLYAGRVDRIARLAKSAKVPLVWLGMPAMNRGDIQPHVPGMNRIFSESVARHGGLYLPTADVLGQSEAAYTSVKLKDGLRLATRADDGVHFTPLGWSLVADAVMQKFSFE